MKSPQKNVREKIESFWKWFAANSAALSSNTIPESLISELEDRLFAIERLDWEIGPGQHAPNLFALSPRGDADLLQTTRNIIALAPELPSWEIYPAKPPRAWNLIFTLSGEDSTVEIDAKCWEFVAYKFKDGTYDLLFKPDDRKGLSEDYLCWAATIVVDGEIGEEARIEKVGQIEVVSSWNEREAPSARKLELGSLSELFDKQ
jgi:hypothetical protein